MKILPLLAIAFAASAHADDAVVLQAQPMAVPLAANASSAPAASKPAIAGKVMVSPKIQATVATRDSNGHLTVGCVERPNPRAGKSPALLLPETQR
jgi:hypothetical protein